MTAPLDAMIRLRFAAALCVLMWWIPQPAFACIAASLNIPDVVRASDLVVMGTITRVEDLGPASMITLDASGRTMRAVLTPDAVLKGEPAREVTFRFLYSALPVYDCRHGTVAPNTYRIVFLRRVNDAYEFTDSGNPSLVAAATSMAGITDPLARVYHVLATVLSGQDVPPSAKDEALFVLALSMNEGTDETRSALRTLARGEDRERAASAVAALMSHNEVSEMDIGERVLTAPAPYSANAVAKVNGALSGVSDGRAIPALLRILRLPDAQSRRAAARALRQTHSSAAIDGLAVALDDDDLDVQYSGVCGLWEIAGDTSGMPSIDHFREQPRVYVARWKEWLRRR